MNQKKNLTNCFSGIRSKDDILDEIEGSAELSRLFNSWNEEDQNVFLDLCTGMRGFKILYDAYFKEVFNPEYTPERLSSLLSVLLERKVTVKQVLPNDSTRIGDETSLIITDIVVELEDKSLANVEVQKIGYRFSGERASCYSADLLLRQYKRLKDENKKNFSYKDIAPVYTIVFFENSPAEFKDFCNTNIHRFSEVSDSGARLNMLQNFVFIPIDLFLNKLHNEGITNELDAWLTFLGNDEPEYIIKLIDKYPYFKDLYQDLYNMCQNVEKVVNMFSEELQILDRNTVKYMIDEYQEQLDDTKRQLDDAKEQLDDTKEQLDDTKEQLNDAKEQLDDAKEQLDDAKEQLVAKDATIAELQAKLRQYEK